MVFTFAQAAGLGGGIILSSFSSDESSESSRSTIRNTVT